MTARRIILAALGAVVGAMLFAACLVWALPAATSSELAGWLEALATAGAFAAAIVAAIYVAKTLDIERRREDRWVHTEMRAQASMVAVWPHCESMRHGGEMNETTGEIPLSAFGVEFRCRNASDVPVTDAMVTATVNLRGHGDFKLGRLPLPVIPPGGTPENHHIVASMSTFEGTGLSEQTYYSLRPTFSLTFEFRDASGLRWRRQPTGVLCEVT